jgi:hypothetical protein
MVAMPIPATPEAEREESCSRAAEGKLVQDPVCKTNEKQKD